LSVYCVLISLVFTFKIVDEDVDCAFFVGECSQFFGAYLGIMLNRLGDFFPIHHFISPYQSTSLSLSFSVSLLFMVMPVLMSVNQEEVFTNSFPQQ